MPGCSCTRKFGMQASSCRQAASDTGPNGLCGATLPKYNSDMAAIFLASLVLATWAEAAGGGTAPQLAGAAMEGKEMRFGLFDQNPAHSTSITSEMS